MSSLLKLPSLKTFHLFSFGKSNLVLFSLLLLDVLFAMNHIYMVLSQNWNTFFALTEDLSLPEYFQYLKLICTLFLLFYLFLRKKDVGYIAWFLFFALLLGDDAFQLHERYGAMLVYHLNLQPLFGLRAVDFGEMLYASLAGFIVIPFMAVSYYKGSWEFRKISVDITLLVGILLFFGIVVDAIHSMLSEVVYISGILALIEDGGEMVAVSIITWYFYFLFMHPNRKELFLHEVFVSS